MRLILIAPLLIAATPAIAETRAPSITPEQAATALQNPVVQDGLAQALTQLAGIVLDTRVGALATLGDGDVRPNDTLRDVERRNDPRFEEHLHAKAHGAVAAAGAMAGQTAELKHTADRLQAALAPLIAMAGGEAR